MGDPEPVPDDANPWRSGGRGIGGAHERRATAARRCSAFPCTPIVVFVVGGLIFIVVGNLCAGLGQCSVVPARASGGHRDSGGASLVRCRLPTHVPGSGCAPGTSDDLRWNFIEHWLQRILYYEAPAWVFTLGYTLFGLVVVATWWYFPPRFNGALMKSTSDSVH
jgi:hypothetical protein